MKNKFIQNKKQEKIILKEEKKIKKVKKTEDRLDRIVPLFTDIIGRLLAAKGMLRYRKDFIEEVKRVMEGEDAEEKSSKTN